ncbi:hypothetical protein [Desulfococcus sp.]|uniref:hypothetical protein n=1 Tax=Desulfococcus sp. TaxID=2025834 RepID=UPI0035944908
MPYSPFYSRFPEIAKHETRAVTVIGTSSWNLPPASYSFHEMFCDEPGCDCRRVFFCIVSSLRQDIQAVIAWGWEDIKFYAKWMGESDPRIINDLKGPALNLASPQSDLAPALLNLLRKMLLMDTTYTERVKRHYAMFRKTVGKKAKAVSSGKVLKKKGWS